MCLQVLLKYVESTVGSGMLRIRNGKSLAPPPVNCLLLLAPPPWIETISLC